MRELRRASKRMAHSVSFGGLGRICYMTKPRTKGQTPRKGVASLSSETKRGDESAVALLDSYL